MADSIDLGGWDYAKYLEDQRALAAQRQQQKSVLDAYIAQQAAKGNEYVPLNPYASSGIDAINYDIYNAMNPNKTAMVFRFDTGNDVGVPSENGGTDYRPAGVVTWQPGDSYSMVDKSGKVIGTADTPEGMAELAALSKTSPFYTLKQTSSANPNVDLGGMMPSKSDYGSFGSMALPMATIAALATGLGALGVGATPAAGAAQAAGTAPAIGGAGAATGAAGGIGGTAATGAGLGSLAAAVPEIVVVGGGGGLGTLGTAALGAGALGGVGGAIGAFGGGQSALPTPQPDEIVVEATPRPITPASISDISGISTGLLGADAATVAATDPVRKAGLSTLDYVRLGLLAPSVVSNVVGAIKGNGGNSLPEDNSAVSYTPMNRAQTIGIGSASPFDVFTYGQGVPGAQQGEFTFFQPSSTGSAVPAAATELKEGGNAKKKLNYQDLSNEEKNFVDYHRRNLAVSPMDNDGGLTTVYGMIDHVDGGEMLHPGYIHGKIMNRDDATRWAIKSGIDFPIYPDAATAEAREMRIHKDIIEPDTRRYKRGDRSFLRGYAEGGDMSDEMVRHLVEWNKGNGHRGPGQVKGIGSGQEDLIPAWLSDGEYVWSAQDVADLGDGSTDEGVRRLDKMRQMVRGRAGRKDVKKIAKPQRGIEHMLKAVGGKV